MLHLLHDLFHLFPPFFPFSPSEVTLSIPLQLCFSFYPCPPPLFMLFHNYCCPYDPRKSHFNHSLNHHASMLTSAQLSAYLSSLKFTNLTSVANFIVVYDYLISSLYHAAPSWKLSAMPRRCITTTPADLESSFNCSSPNPVLYVEERSETVSFQIGLFRQGTFIYLCHLVWIMCYLNFQMLKFYRCL